MRQDKQAIESYPEFLQKFNSAAASDSDAELARWVEQVFQQEGFAPLIDSKLSNWGLAPYTSAHNTTALARAVSCAKWGCARRLLELGATPDLRVLSLALEAAPFELCQAMISHERLDKREGSYMMNGLFNKLIFSKEPLGKARFKELALGLMEQGADLCNGSSAKGKSPLHLATSNGKEEQAWALIELGASLEQKDWEGQTPIDAAMGEALKESLRACQTARQESAQLSLALSEAPSRGSPKPKL